jgi:hypothetical protein
MTAPDLTPAELIRVEGFGIHNSPLDPDEINADFEAHKARRDDLATLIADSFSEPEAPDDFDYKIADTILAAGWVRNAN